MAEKDSIHVRVRLTTKKKLDTVAQLRDWTRVVTAEKAADALLRQEGIDTAAVRDTPTGRRRRAKRAAAI